ncbi:sensor histidine kinase [Prolixibacteraceae bacterium JC049]|jgi:two-component system phosphate regulon sensor histidine kinase PhoR|nr:sensor histidine kinase [Prolixibacteraceae bacterium JC049]
MKTYSARQLAIYIALSLSGIGVIFFFLAHYLENVILGMVLLAPLFFAISFLFVQYMLNHYIYQKIQPIYKAVRGATQDSKKKLSNAEANSNIISAVNEEVKIWTNTKEKEIARLKDLEKYRKEFIGNVSHELKTPIFNIQGYILTLLEGGLDDSKINRFYLERTEKSIDRMISIVEDLESISKLESGELKINRSDFNLVKLAEEVIDIEYMLAKQRKIDLEIYTRTDKPIMVNADKKRIFEVLSNLVTNAIKYGKKKGYVKIGFFDMDDNVLVEVTDNGIGMEQDYLPRIFERFYRVDKSRSREQGGTGLGLAIVKHIIEAHKQTINVKSVPDQGTTFTFTLKKGI